MARRKRAVRAGLALAAPIVLVASFAYFQTRHRDASFVPQPEASASDATETRGAVATAATRQPSAPLASTVRRIQPTDPAPMPRRISVSLSEEPPAEIEVRPLRLPSIARPERLADVYAHLRILAEAGDLSAAYGLYRWLNECQHAFPDAASLDKALDTLRDEGVRTYPDSSRLSKSSRRSLKKGDRAAEAATAMKQAHEFCDGIEPEQRAEASAWLEKAASSGEVFALRARADEMLMAKDRARFTSAYEELWSEHGYTGALSPLAVMYRRGVGGNAPDYVRSYAYQLTELRLMQTVYGNSAYPSHRNMLMGIENALSNTASYLTPQQTADAVRMSDQWLRSNPHCCVGLLFGATYE